MCPDAAATQSHSRSRRSGVSERLVDASLCVDRGRLSCQKSPLDATAASSMASHRSVSAPSTVASLGDPAVYRIGLQLQQTALTDNAMLQKSRCQNDNTDRLEPAVGRSCNRLLDGRPRTLSILASSAW